MDISQIKKSKNYKPSTEEEKLLASLDDMRNQFQKQAEQREKEEMKGFNALMFGLATFVLGSANAMLGIETTMNLEINISLMGD